MKYDNNLSECVRTYLQQFPKLAIEEKQMFGGLAFLVNGKMCVNISGNRLMCRFDPQLATQLSKRLGYSPMIMKGKTYRSYCYVDPKGYTNKKDFAFWIKTCLAFNEQAKKTK